jgi:hypothetical protein
VALIFIPLSKGTHELANGNPETPLSWVFYFIILFYFISFVSPALFGLNSGMTGTVLESWIIHIVFST